MINIKKPLSPKQRQVYDLIVACKENNDKHISAKISEAFKMTSAETSIILDAISKKGWIKTKFHQAYREITLTP